MQTPTVAVSELPRLVLDTLVEAGADFFVSVPCNTLGGLLEALRQDGRVRHVPVTREEEGVGLCAGAALAGKLPVLLMQNSGLGNCINALLSLTRLYELPLVILASYRGGPDEPIVAQRPMGQAMRPLLGAIGSPYREIEHARQAPEFGELVRAAAEGSVVAGIVHPGFWDGG
jgi:sulfopyruvate decarboxylase subunit alpha